MNAVAYFTAVVARTGSAWRARDVELDEGGGLDELADMLRSVAVDDEPVIAVLEHEDEWFALVAVPLASVIAYAASWWVTTTVGEEQPRDTRSSYDVG